MPKEWVFDSMDIFVEEGIISLGRGDVISKNDIKRYPGDFPIYSSSVKNDGLFGKYGKFMFDEELITWSVDGGGDFFYRPKHKFSVTNVSGYMKVNEEKFDYKFLAYYLQNEHAKKHFDYQHKAHPSVIRKSYNIAMPEISEQRDIAEIIGSIDEDIEKTQDVIKETEKLKKGLMQKLFTRGIGHKKFKKTKLGVIPEEWEIKKGEEISKLITKGASPKWQGFEYQDNGMIFVTSENVRDGLLDLSVTKFLPMDFYHKLKNSQLKNGDILINIVGASIGRSCIYTSDYEHANINQAVCLFRLDKTINNNFVLQYLQSPHVISRLLGSQGGSARANLSLTDIRNFQFIIPSCTEQEKIAEILSAVDEKISVNKKLKSKLIQLKKGLMQDLLSGKVRVN